jgi:hypothetical protein
MNSYKESWQEEYERLAYELFDKPYWECLPNERKQLDVAIRDWELDYLPSLIDAAESREER